MTAIAPCASEHALLKQGPVNHTLQFASTHWSRIQLYTQNAFKGYDQFPPLALTNLTTATRPLFALPLGLQPDSSNLTLLYSLSLNHPTLLLRPLFSILSLSFAHTLLSHITPDTLQTQRGELFFTLSVFLDPQPLQYLRNSLPHHYRKGKENIIYS